MTEFAGRTHPGHRRGENEDSIGWNPEQGLWFVADGMGGHAAGAVASNVVKETLLKLPPTVDLVDGVRQAHAAVIATADANPEYRGMGSALVSIHIASGVGSVVWVGDSRAYLWRQGTLRRLTRDHSVAEMLREQQILTDEEIEKSPDRHSITQTLGLGDPQPSLNKTPLQSGDWVLLCSDGLTDELNDPAIIEVMRQSSSPDAAADGLINGALDRGGRDNVSVIIVAYDGPSARTASARLDGTRVVLLSILGGAGAALACAAVWRHFFSQR
jgi:protein phosphatase